MSVQEGMHGCATVGPEKLHPAVRDIGKRIANCRVLPVDHGDEVVIAPHHASWPKITVQKHGMVYLATRNISFEHCANARFAQRLIQLIGTAQHATLKSTGLPWQKADVCRLQINCMDGD